MNYVERLLSCNERIVRVARDHWITLLPTILVDVAITIVIVGLVVLGTLLSPPWTWFGLLLLVVPIGHFVLRLWLWWNEQFLPPQVPPKAWLFRFSASLEMHH